MTQPERDDRELVEQLASLDRELVDLVERRAEIASRLGALRQSGEGDGPSPRPVPPELIARALENARGLLPREVLAKIVRSVATACAPLLEPARIAFVGATGGSGHEAARQRFGDGAHLVGGPSIEAALAAVVEGRAVFAVVPYERKPAGIVDETVQALLAGDLRVLACFDSRAGSEDGEAASPRSGNDSPSSQSPPSSSESEASTEMMRYAVIGARPTRRTGNDRTALVFTLADDAPGALHEVLMAFKECDVNLTHIHSRPGKLGDPRHVGTTSHGGWSYLFYVEMYGHITDRAVVTALDGARRATKFVRVLGSYARE